MGKDLKQNLRKKAKRNKKGFGCWKGIKTNAKAELVTDFRKSRGPVPLDLHQRF